MGKSENASSTRSSSGILEAPIRTVVVNLDEEGDSITVVNRNGDSRSYFRPGSEDFLVFWGRGTLGKAVAEIIGAD